MLWHRHMRSVRRVRLEPVHDQTGDFGLTLEVREVPDIRQETRLWGPMKSGSSFTEYLAVGSLLP